MNIGLFTDTYFPQINGVGISTHVLAKTLREMGHNAYIFTPHDPKEKKDDFVIRVPSLPFMLVKNYRVGTFYSEREFEKIDRYKLDIIHTQTEFSLGILGKLYARRRGIPVVHTYHTLYAEYMHYLINGNLVTPEGANGFSRVFCNVTNYVIAPTEKTKEYLLKQGIVRPIKVIPTGLDLSNFQNFRVTSEEQKGIKESIGLDPQCPVVISLGRLGKEKSVNVIISAMPKLLEKLPDAKLVIVGDGPAKDDLRYLAKSLGLKDSVIFTGAKPWNEIVKYYKLGDVFVSASLTETQGLTFTEAMASGVPVVAKKDKSIEGVVVNGKTGIIFEKNEELPDVLCELLGNGAMRNYLSKNALKYIESVSAETFGKSVLELYRELLENMDKYSMPKRTLVYFLRQMATRKLNELNTLMPVKRQIIKYAKYAKYAKTAIKTKGEKENDSK